MTDTPNPFAPPSAMASLVEPSNFPKPIQPASSSSRLINLIVDYIAQLVIGFVFGVIVVVVGGEEGANALDKVPNFVIGFPILFAYYFILETTTGRTLGKLLTGTKVVRDDGGPPTAAQVAGRTLCRMIPFEQFSFFGDPPHGWHDSISKTRVVKA